MTIRTGRELRDWLNTLTDKQLDLRFQIGGFEDRNLDVGIASRPYEAIVLDAWEEDQEFLDDDGMGPEVDDQNGASEYETPTFEQEG